MGNLNIIIYSIFLVIQNHTPARFSSPSLVLAESPFSADLSEALVTGVGQKGFGKKKNGPVFSIVSVFYF